jgi:hypothetical protein
VNIAPLCLRTYEEVYFVDISGADGSRSYAGQTSTIGINKLLRCLEACHISHGAKEALAVPLEGKHWEASAASCCSALIQSDPCAVQHLRQSSSPGHVRPRSVLVAALVSVCWTWSTPHQRTCLTDTSGQAYEGRPRPRSF